MNDPAIPPMPELAAWILKHEIDKYPSFSETEVAKRARSRILNRRGGKGKFLTENAKYWIARMQGGGGVGKNSVLPIGHTTMDKSLSWREGFRTEGDPVIIEERDYPGLDLQQIADLFTAQAIVLYRTETRGSNTGPDISNLADPEPLTAINMEGETNFDLLLTQRKQREAYANMVLRSLHYAVPETMGINFNSTRGRIHGLHPLMFNPGTENVGIALPIPQPNEVSNLVCVEILGTAITSTRVLLERGEILAEALEEKLSAKTMLCSKGKTAYIYIAGGTMGGLSYNDVYDSLATMGKLVGNPASNSKVSYKDIEFKNLGIKVSRESFTRRNEDVLQLPLSLDIYPSKEKESMSKAYEGSHRLGAAFNQTGLAITPVANPMVFDPGYDDHPQIVQYRMNEMAPAVIEFLRQGRVAIPESAVEPELVLPSNAWQQMRTENAKVKEAKQEDLERVIDAFCIPKGREVSLVFDGTQTVMQVNNELAFTGIPQTNDFNQYCIAAGIESISVKGILTPSNGTNHALLDRVVEMDVIPSDLGESLNTFMPLEVQVYGVLDDSPLSSIRGLGYPRAKFVRNISTETEGSNFAELVTDELDDGYATRILLGFSDEESKNMYSEQVLDAAVIGFDLEGKNPQNGMIGKVIVALLSSEKIRVDKGGKPRTIKAEMYNPIGVVGAFAGFDVDAKRRIFEHLSNNATHPGYDDGYLMVNPEKANLVVRVMHKGVLSVKRQPRFRLVTKMKDFVGPTIPVERSPLDSTLGRGVPTDMNLQRLQFGGRPEKVPGNANLEPFDEVELPIMRSPTITSIVTEVDGFEEHFISKDDTYSSRYSEQSERLTFTAPLSQLPFNNPLRGAEPILDDAYEGPVDVQTLLTASLNPPTENWSAHRQRVPWDFAPNAFGRGSAFRTFKMDDPTSRRKAIHMNGWNRRYDKYKGVQAIAGRLLNGKWHIQSIRVPRKYKLRRTLKEVRLDRKRPPKWYKELHPEAKPFGTKKNPPSGFNVVLSGDPQQWSTELNLVSQGMDLLSEWFPSVGIDFTEKMRTNIEADFESGNFETLTQYLNSDYWKEIRDLVIIHDGKYHHSRGGLGFGQTASTSDKSYTTTSFSLPFLRRVPSVLPVIHETGHLIGATQRDFEIDDGHHCTNDCIMTDDATMNYMEWEERLRNEGRWNKDMFCPTCITQIEAKNNPIIPHNYIKAMDRGWTGFPTWAIQPTFSISDLQGNPPWALEHQTNPYIMMKEPFPYRKYNEDTEKYETAYLEVPIDEKLAPLIRHLWDKKQATWYSDSGRRGDGYFAMRKPFDYALERLKTIESDLKVLKIKTTKLGYMKKAEEILEVRWHGLDALKKIYAVFGVKYPETRKEAVEGAKTKKNPPIGVATRNQTLDGRTHFYNAETREILTGKIFDGALLETKDGKWTMDTGEELDSYPSDERGRPRGMSVNVALLPGYGPIAEIRSMANPIITRYFAKTVVIETPLMLATEPWRRREPSGLIVTNATAIPKRTGQSVRGEHGARIPMYSLQDFEIDKVTDFQGRGKGDRGHVIFEHVVLTDNPEAHGFTRVDKAYPSVLDIAMSYNRPRLITNFKTLIPKIDEKMLLELHKKRILREMEGYEMNPPWEEDEDEEPPTPEEYSVPNEKGVVAQHIETQDEAESIALRWTNKTDEDFVPFEMIYTMPDGSRRWAVVRKPEGGKSGSPLVSPMRSSPHYLESANKYGLGTDCPRCGSNYTEKVGRVRVAVQDGPAHVMEGGYHCNYCGFDWDTESMDLVRLNNPPKKTPGGKTIPKRYLKGLTKEEMAIAIKEIDKGYKYDIADPEAYEYWKSDIKATARGYKTVPSKYKKKFIKMYGPLPEKGKFIDKIAKATKIKKRILQKVYDKGLAAWRVGHRPGVQQHQWAAGRVYSFVTLGNTVVKGKKKMSDYTLAVEAGIIKDGELIKKNPVVYEEEVPNYHEYEENWLAERLYTERRILRSERTGLFVGALHHEEHIGKIASNLDRVILVDPSFSQTPWREEVFRQFAPNAEIEIHAIPLSEYLEGANEEFSLVHYPHRPSAGAETTDVNEVNPATSIGFDLLEKIKSQSDDRTIFINIKPEHLPGISDDRFLSKGYRTTFTPTRRTEPHNWTEEQLEEFRSQDGINLDDLLRNPLKVITSNIISISGRSGSGKSTIAKGIKKRLGRDARIVPSYMTRKKRTNEEEPKDGVFITKKKFKEMIKRGEFTSSNGTDLWVQQESGHFYGRRAADFEKSGVAIVDVSFPGLKLMRESFGDKVYAVLIKSRMGDERNREILRRRGVHTEEEIERRVRIGSYMMKEENWKPLNFDFVASNRRGELDKNIAMISAEFRKSMNRPACPLATQDLEVNTKNRDHAIAAEHIQYGPLNLNDEAYWERYAKKWNTTADVAKKSNCSNCIAFDISPRMKKCMPGETSDPEGELGYCWMHHFKCHSARTCNTWAAGGPIDLDKVSFDWQERNAQVKKNPPKEPPTVEEFREWVDLVNMKNKELKAFMDSDWFAVSGLTPDQAKDQGIKSGQDSFRAIIRMRKKLGLRGPKDYIKSGPRITKQFYELALKKWTGPNASVPVNDDLTDWGWMKRQLRFNKRASSFPYNQAEEKRKGPLVKKQKTQNKPSRRLLSLWVWGHDPWRWARKHGVERMPKCPDVPWVGMTEKRKYGKVPVLMGPKQNPPSTNLEWEYTPKVPNEWGSMHTLQGYDRAEPLRYLPPYNEIAPNIQVKWNITTRLPDRWPYRTHWFDMHGISSVAENIQIRASQSGKGHGQAAYLKILDYVDAVYSRSKHTNSAERAWEALEKRQSELGITIEKIPDVWGNDGPHSARLMKRLQNNPKKNPAYPSKKHGHFPETVLSTFSPLEEENHEKTQKHQKKHDAAVKKEMQKTFPGWTWNQMPLEGKEGAKEAKALRAARKKVDGEIGAFTVCPVDCKFCMVEQGTKQNPKGLRPRKKCPRTNPCGGKDIYRNIREARKAADNRYDLSYYRSHQCGPNIYHLTSRTTNNPPESIPEYLFHVTAKKNMESILETGLKPKIGELSRHAFGTKEHYDKKIGSPVVWGATQNKSTIYASMVSPFVFKKDNAVFRIKTEGLDFQYYANEEYFTRKAVPPSHIEFVYYMDGEHAGRPKQNPPGTMMTAFQTDGPRADNNQLYAGGGKVVQAKMRSGDFEKHPTYGTRYKKYPATDPDQKHFSPLPFIARKWKKSTFKSQPETDYTYFKEQLEQDNTPYTVTLKIDGEGTLAHFNGKETVIWNWYDRWRTNFHITDEITKKLKKKGVKSAKIMGEMYAVDEKGMMLPMTGGSRDEEGRSETVGSIIKTTGDASTMDRQNRIRWAAFDLLELNGVDMRNEPFEERIDMLKELLSTKGTAIVVPHRRGKGLKPFKTAWEKWMRDPEFEGGVLRFDTGKTFKVKGAMTADMAVIGYYYGSSEEREGRGGSFADWAGGLALAFMDENGNYVYSGNVGTGFTHADRQELEESLSKQQVSVGPTITKWNGHLLANGKGFGKHDDTGKGIMYAVQPSMIVEVEYRGLNWGDKPVYGRLGETSGVLQQVGVTQAPTLFQPSFKRYRFDKELTPFDLRMSQVAGEGKGKWKKNGVNTSYTVAKRTKLEIPRIVVWPRHHTVADLRKNPNLIFLFGDNDRRTGKRGQAIIRGEPNAFGIRTKHKPATSTSSYFSDERYEKNIKMMKDDFVKALEAVPQNGTLVLPRDGLGTGLADLPNKAPQTFAWLQQLSEMLNTFATDAGTEAEVRR